MNLISPTFLFIFLPVFLLAYLICNQSVRLPLILAAGVIFITAGQAAALMWLGGILVIGFFLGRAIASPEGKATFWPGIGLTIAVLASLKFLVAYGAGSVAWVRLPEAWRLPISGLSVPIGLSYVTLQMISYLVDVWKGTVPAENNFLRLAAYVFFFPKLVSGPLVRYQPFAEQLSQISPSMDDVAAGFRRFLTGFIKRTLIAGPLASVANAAFNLPTANLEPRFAWLAILAYTLQIFFDFAGYTDMAIGLGLMIGIRLPENFVYPYIAQSMSEFWRRWHMTLTAWFREYVFYPLERRRFRWFGQQINILIVFALTGLWHGFTPNYLIWGLLHGIALSLEGLWFGRWLKRAWRPVRHLYTAAVVIAGWVFFRANTPAFALDFFSRLAGNTSGLAPLPFSATTPLPFIEPSFVLALAAGVIFSLPLSPIWQQFRGASESRRPSLFFVFQPLEDILLIVFFALGLGALLASTFAPNIYARF